MALRIRLARGGAKKRPFYRIIVAEATAPRDGRFVEKLGIYNPLVSSSDRLVFDAARVKYWLAQGAKPTTRIARFLEAADIVPRQTRNNPLKGRPGEKARQREEERLAQKQEQKEQAEQQTAAKEESPAETPPEKPAETPPEASAEAPSEASAEEETAPAEGAADDSGPAKEKEEAKGGAEEKAGE